MKVSRRLTVKVGMFLSKCVLTILSELQVKKSTEMMKQTFGLKFKYIFESFFKTVRSSWKEHDQDQASY